MIWPRVVQFNRLHNSTSTKHFTNHHETQTLLLLITFIQHYSLLSSRLTVAHVACDSEWVTVSFHCMFFNIRHWCTSNTVGGCVAGAITIKAWNTRTNSLDLHSCYGLKTAGVSSYFFGCCVAGAITRKAWNTRTNSLDLHSCYGWKRQGCPAICLVVAWLVPSQEKHETHTQTALIWTHVMAERRWWGCSALCSRNRPSIPR